MKVHQAGYHNSRVRNQFFAGSGYPPRIIGPIRSCDLGLSLFPVAIPPRIIGYIPMKVWMKTLWLVVSPLWKILISWDDYSQYMEKYKMFQTTNQLYMFSHTLLASHQITTKTCSEFRSIIPQWFNDGQFTPGFPINFPLVYQYHSFPYSYFDGHHHMGLMILITLIDIPSGNLT